ncbi:MAG: type II toxin-antitoxin system VapC family toxin [Pseudomonadota bacterium]
MIQLILCDTCVVIDFINQNSDTLDKLKEQGNILCINSIIEMELIQGAHNKREMQKIIRNINGLRRLEINQAILDLATQLQTRYLLSHHLQLPDAIIAACALIYDIPIFTYNIKHFKYIPKIKRL